MTLTLRSYRGQEEFNKVKITNLLEQPNGHPINLPAILPSINVVDNRRKRALLETIKKISPSFNNKKAIQALQGTLPKNELAEFLKTGGSNGRALKWDVMELPKGMKFSLHAHPNVEMILCIKGRIHELRLVEDGTGVGGGCPVKKFDLEIPEGPDLSKGGGDWKVRTLYENEVSIMEGANDNDKERPATRTSKSEVATLSNII